MKTKKVPPIGFEWKFSKAPIDLREQVIFLQTPCGQYIFAIVDCLSDELNKRRNEHLLYKCVQCPPEEKLLLQGPFFHPKYWFVYDNPTMMLRRTAKYKGLDQRWMTLKVMYMQVEGQAIYRNVPLRLLSKCSGGPGFKVYPFATQKWKRLRAWTKNMTPGRCRNDKQLSIIDYTLADAVKL